MKKTLVNIAVMLLCCLNAFTQTRQEEISPAMVYQLSLKAKGEIDLIRQKMNKPVYDPIPFMVEDVSPREVYFQAITLYNNCGKLKFQFIQELPEIFAIPDGDIIPAQVYGVVQKSISELENIKSELGISASAPLPPLDESMQPTNVFKSIVQANRQLGDMLEEKMSPGNVLEQVTQSLSYIGAIYMSFDNVRMLPEPAFVDGKLPKDVYAELLISLAIMSDIAKELDIVMADVNEITRDDIKPRDVYDLASLCLSEAIFLYQKTNTSVAVANSVYPGERSPSHVHQRAHYLNQYLEAIRELLNNDAALNRTN